MEAFELKNDPEPPKKWKPDLPEKGRQQVLFTGLACCRGQEQLFQTDGPPERVEPRGVRYCELCLKALCHGYCPHCQE